MSRYQRSDLDLAEAEGMRKLHEAADAKFTEGLEEFVGPSSPDEFTLFVMPERQPYREQLDGIVAELKEGVESGKIQEIGMVFKMNGGYHTRFSGTEGKTALAASLLTVALERLGFVRE